MGTLSDEKVTITDEMLVSKIQEITAILNSLAETALERGISVDIEAYKRADPYDASVSVTMLAVRGAMKRIYTPAVLVAHK